MQVGERIGSLECIGDGGHSTRLFRCDCGHSSYMPPASARKHRECTYCKRFRNSPVLQRRRRYAWVKESISRRAGTIVAKAVRRGEVVRPEACSRCGAGGRIEAHHDDYTRPLEVVWLCRPCHSQRHVRLRELGRDPWGGFDLDAELQKTEAA